MDKKKIIYMRGLGVGILVTAVICLLCRACGGMSDEEIIEKAKELGMVEANFVSDDREGTVNVSEIKAKLSGTPAANPTNPDDKDQQESPLTPVPSDTPTPLPTDTPTPTPTDTPTPTASPSPVLKETPAFTPTPVPADSTKPVYFEVDIPSELVNSEDICIYLEKAGVVSDWKELSALSKEIYFGDLRADYCFRVGKYVFSDQMDLYEVIRIVTGM